MFAGYRKQERTPGSKFGDGDGPNLCRVKKSRC